MTDLHQQNELRPDVAPRLVIPFLGKMTLVILMMLIFAMTLFLVISLEQYRIQKTDLLSEFQIQKLRVTESRLRAFLTRRQDSTSLPPQAELKGSQNNGEFADFWEGGEELTYLTDHQGNLVASNADSFEGANLMRALQTTAKQLAPSNQSASVLRERSAFAQSIVAYSPLEGTNLVVFVESNTEGKLRLLRVSVGHILVGLIFVIFLGIVLSEVFSNKFSNYLAELVSVFDDINFNSHHESSSPLSAEFEILENHFTSLSSLLKESAAQAGLSEEAKSALVTLVEKLNGNFDSKKMHKELSSFLAKVLNKDLRLTIALYECDRMLESFSSAAAFPKIQKIFLMRSGFPADELKAESSHKESWKIEDTIRFSKNWKPELITENEVRFPIAHNTTQVFFLLLSGSGIKTLPKAYVQWIVLGCNAYGLSLPLSKQSAEI